MQTCRARVDRGLPRGTGVPPEDPQNTRENLRYPAGKERWIQEFTLDGVLVRVDNLQ